MGSFAAVSEEGEGKWMVDVGRVRNVLDEEPIIKAERREESIGVFKGMVDAGEEKEVRMRQGLLVKRSATDDKDLIIVCGSVEGLFPRMVKETVRAVQVGLGGDDDVIACGEGTAG